MCKVYNVHYKCARYKNKLKNVGNGKCTTKFKHLYTGKNKPQVKNELKNNFNQAHGTIQKITIGNQPFRKKIHTDNITVTQGLAI